MSLEAALAYLNTKLDAAYKASAKTAAMDVNPAWVRKADVAGTFYLPDLAMVGLGNVTAGVFPDGDVTQTWNAYTYAYDRGRKIQIDTVAKDEAGQIAEIATVAAEYMRMNVVPEIDALRFEKLAAATTPVTAAITTSTNAIAATNLALVTLANAEADMDNLLFFCVPDILELLENAASTERVARVLSRAKVIEVPQGRFNETIALNAGATSSAGGFTAAGDELNFILMDKGAAFADAKHVAERFFPAAVNQAGDMARWDYRIVHDCWVYSQKTAGIYVHKTDTVS